MGLWQCWSAKATVYPLYRRIERIIFCAMRKMMRADDSAPSRPPLIPGLFAEMFSMQYGTNTRFEAQFYALFQ